MLFFLELYDESGKVSSEFAFVVVVAIILFNFNIDIDSFCGRP